MGNTQNKGYRNAAPEPGFGMALGYKPVSHRILSSVNPKEIINFVDFRETYELEVPEKQKEVPSMTEASYKLCVMAHLLRMMVFIRMFDNAAPDDTDMKDLTSELIKAAIEESVSEVRKKVPDSRFIVAALFGLRIAM